MRQTQNNKLRRLVMIALFTALAYVAMMVIHIKVSFLTLDLKDAFITLCGLYFGPLAALFVSVAVPLLELFTVSDTGAYGLIMNILGSVTFSLTVSLFYKWRKTLFGAIAGLVSGALLMTAVMVGANLLITPFFLKTSVEQVKALIPALLLPFNLLKGTVNVGMVLFLYKPLSRVMHRLHVTPSSPQKEENAPRKAHLITTVCVGIVSTLLIVGSLIMIFTLLGGKFDFQWHSS